MSYSERCGFSVGSFLSLFFLVNWRKKPALGSILPNQFFRGVISGSKVYFFFFFFFFLSHATFEITPVMGWAIILLSLTLCCRSDCAAQTQRLVEKLPKLPSFICLCIWHCHREHLILLFTGPAAACWTDGLEEWHRLCLKGRPWSTCSSGTAGLTGSGDLLSVRAERKRSFSRSGPSGLTGTFYTCIAVTLISGGCLGDWWSLFRRTDEICPNLHW